MTIVERNELIENYIPLANKLACKKKKLLPKKVDLDDLKSAAYFGLVDAAQKYNPAKNVSFGTYATWRIIGEIKDFIRESCRDQSRCPMSLDEPNKNGETMAGNIPQGEPSKFEEVIEDITKHLNDLDKNVLVMYYIDDMSLKEIGSKIGVSESRVSQLLKRSKENVRLTIAA